MKTFEEYLSEKRITNKALEGKYDDPQLGNYITSDDYENLRRALEEGANPNYLNYVMGLADAESITLLAEFGADLDAKVGDKTPIMYASWYHWDKAIVALLEGGANPNVYDKDGFYPIQYAVYADNLDLLKAYIKHKAKLDVVSKNPQQLTLLGCAVDAKPVAKKCIKYLIDNGLVEVSEEDGARALAPHRTNDKKILDMLGA